MCPEVRNIRMEVCAVVCGKLFFVVRLCVYRHAVQNGFPGGARRWFPQCPSSMKDAIVRHERDYFYSSSLHATVLSFLLWRIY